MTELVETPEVQITGQVLKQDGKPDLVDDGLIQFGQMVAVPGLAFPVAGENSLNLSGPSSSDGKAVPVFKQWQKSPDGRMFIVESVAWDEIEPLLKDLRAQANNAPVHPIKVAQNRVWPNAIATAARRTPMQVASVPYRPTGYLVDLELLSGSASSKTFLAGTTYYIPSFYQVTGSSTFQGGATIKLGPSATLSLSGTFTSPTTGVTTLTSRDDNTAGETVVNAGNPPYTSDGVVSASDWSNASLSLYNGAANITVYRFRIRYANRGISDYSPYYTHTVQYCRMENCGFGVFAYYTTVNMTNNEVCNVATNAFAYTGAAISENGTITECGPFLRVASFAGLNQGDTIQAYPDTMGAVGPSHFMTTLNCYCAGGYSVAVFNKYTGAKLSPNNTTLSDFFSVTVPSGQPYAGTYPTGAAGDPYLLYDHLSQRWIATSIDSSFILLAVSNGPDPVGNGGPNWVSDNWKKYVIPFGPCPTDHPTVGVDGNGIYICSHLFQNDPCNVLTKIAALPKAQFTNGTAQPIPMSFLTNVPGRFTYAAVNFDPVTTNDLVWFLANDHSTSTLHYNALKWTHGLALAPEWQFPTLPSDWNVFTNQLVASQPGKAPQPCSNVQIDTDFGSTIMTAVARKVGGNQYLWTCRQLPVNGDRWAIEWFKLQASSSVTVADTGRIYDSAPANPKFYYLPSLAVNKNGDMVIGFSGSSANDYVGAYYWARLNNGTSMSSPVRYFAGKDCFENTIFGFFFPARLGDYSWTTLDPDGLTIWTIQEYAELRSISTQPQKAFGTWISAVTPF